MRAGQRSGDDLYMKERMTGEYSKPYIDPEYSDPKEARAEAADYRAYPAQTRFSAAEPGPSAVSEDGTTWHKYATLQVAEPMELPNFTNSPQHGTQALTWAPDELSSEANAWASREVGQAPPFVRFSPSRQAQVDQERPSDQLFTHAPGTVNQAETHPDMQRTTGTLAALGHRDLPTAVRMGQPFKKGPLHIDTGLLMDTATANEHHITEGGEWKVKGHIYDDHEVGQAQEEALAHAFPTSRRDSFVTGIQGRLF